MRSVIIMLRRVFGFQGDLGTFPTVNRENSASPFGIPRRALRNIFPVDIRVPKLSRDLSGSSSGRERPPESIPADIQVGFRPELHSRATVGDRELRKAPQKCRFLAVLLPVPFAHGNGTDVFVALLLLHTVCHSDSESAMPCMTTYNIITNLVVVFALDLPITSEAMKLQYFLR